MIVMFLGVFQQDVDMVSVFIFLLALQTILLNVFYPQK